MLTKGLRNIFLLLLLCSGCTTNQRHIPFNISFSCWFRDIGETFWVLRVFSDSTRDAKGPGDCGSGVFIAEEAGVGDKESRDSHSNQCRDMLGGTSVGLPFLGLFSSTAKILGYPMYQHPE
jgi:hypothetical protein